MTAQWVLTNFPYFGFRQRSLGSERSQIIVVPVTMDDSKGELKSREFLTAASQDEAMRTWMNVIEANAENNAVSCLLIHPTDITYKMETERRLIQACKSRDFWIGDVGSIARFWRDRSSLRPVFRQANNGAVVVILNQAWKDLPAGQTLVIEHPEGSLVPQILDSTGQTIQPKIHQVQDRLYLTIT